MIPVAEALHNRCGSVARQTATQGRRRLRTGASAHREGGLCLRVALTLAGALWYHIRRGAWIRTPALPAVRRWLASGFGEAVLYLFVPRMSSAPKVPDAFLIPLPFPYPSYPLYTYLIHSIYIEGYGYPMGYGMGYPSPRVWARVRLPFGFSRSCQWRCKAVKVVVTWEVCKQERN